MSLAMADTTRNSSGMSRQNFLRGRDQRETFMRHSKVRAKIKGTKQPQLELAVSAAR